VIIDINERPVPRDIGETYGFRPGTEGKIFEDADAVPVGETEHLFFLLPKSRPNEWPYIYSLPKKGCQDKNATADAEWAYFLFAGRII
jgi:hypothetical protein